MVNFYRVSSGVYVDWCVYCVLCFGVFGELGFECVEYCLRGREVLGVCLFSSLLELTRTRSLLLTHTGLNLGTAPSSRPYKEVTLMTCFMKTLFILLSIYGRVNGRVNPANLRIICTSWKFCESNSRGARPEWLPGCAGSRCQLTIYQYRLLHHNWTAKLPNIYQFSKPLWREIKTPKCHLPTRRKPKVHGERKNFFVWRRFKHLNSEGPETGSL